MKNFQFTKKKQHFWLKIIFIFRFNLFQTQCIYFNIQICRDLQDNYLSRQFHYLCARAYVYVILTIKYLLSYEN